MPGTFKKIWQARLLALWGMAKHTYLQKKGDLYGWPSGEAVRKCEACLNGSREFAIEAVKEVSMNG